MNYIDVHCHIDFYENVSSIIKDAKKAGVKIIINNGINQETNRKTLDLAKNFPEVKAALGIYPLNALKMADSKIDAEISFIRENKDKMVAIGEVGLDFKEDKENIERQKEIFYKFINLALELDKPIIVHSRKAEKECIEILEKSGIKKVIMHCFSGKFSLAKKIESLGWFLSIPASVKNSEHFQNIAKNISINNLFCETDSPYLHPDKKRDNTPKFVVESYKKIAELKGISLTEVKDKIEKNYNSLFKK